jgi:YVTN family beta-propeller protein
MTDSIRIAAALCFAAGIAAGQPTLVGTITTAAPTAVAANPITNRVYLANQAQNQVLVIDGATNTVTATVPVPASVGANYVVVNKAINQYAVAGGSSALVFDGLTNAPIVPITPNSVVVGNAAFTDLVVNEATNKLYSTTIGSILVTDLVSGTVSLLANPSLKPGDICNVHSLAVNTALNWVYATVQCSLASAAMIVFDGATGAMLQAADLGASIPFGANVGEIVFNPQSNKLYVANYGGFGINTQAPVPPSVEVYNAVTIAHLASVPNIIGPLAVDTVLNAVYGMSGNTAGIASVIDGGTDTLNSTFTIGFSVSGLDQIPIGVNEATHMVYFINSAGGSVSVFQGTLPAPATFSASG